MWDPYHKSLGSRDPVFPVGYDWILGVFVVMHEWDYSLLNSQIPLCFNAMKMTQMYSSNFLHLIGLLLKYVGQKVVTMTVF